MTEANTVVVTPEVDEVEDKSSETRLWENIQNNMERFPASLKVTRNEVLKEFGSRPYNRGDKKEAGLKFVGPVERVEVDNLETWIKFFGVEKVCSILQNAITSIAIAASERSVGDDNQDGVYNEEILLKGLQEFSSAGETIKELKEKLAEAQADFLSWQKEVSANPALLAPNHPKNSEILARMQSIADVMGYCNSNMAARVRGPRKKK